MHFSIIRAYQRFVRNTAFFLTIWWFGNRSERYVSRCRTFWKRAPPALGSSDYSLIFSCTNLSVAFWSMLLSFISWWQRNNLCVVCIQCRCPIRTVHTTLVLGQSLCVFATFHRYLRTSVIFSYYQPAVR